mgnify:CR=1 FL=1
MPLVNYLTILGEFEWKPILKPFLACSFSLGQIFVEAVHLVILRQLIQNHVKLFAYKACAYFSKDLSPKTKKEVLFLRDKYRPELDIAALDADMEQIESALR